MNIELKSIFQAVEIFHDLTEEDLLEVMWPARLITARAGEAIFDVGQHADAFYIIQEGRVRIQQTFADGAKETLATLETGQQFGEMSLLDGSLRSARATAVTPVRLYRIERADFEQLRSRRHPAALKLLRNIAQVMSRRVRDTNRKVIDFLEDSQRSLEYLKARQVAQGGQHV